MRDTQASCITGCLSAEPRSPPAPGAGFTNPRALESCCRMERSPSGRGRGTGNAVRGQPLRGFESLPLRHQGRTAPLPPTQDRREVEARSRPGSPPPSCSTLPLPEADLASGPCSARTAAAIEAAESRQPSCEERLSSGLGTHFGPPIGPMAAPCHTSPLQDDVPRERRCIAPDHRLPEEPTHRVARAPARTMERVRSTARPGTVTPLLAWRTRRPTRTLAGDGSGIHA